MPAHQPAQHSVPCLGVPEIQRVEAELSGRIDAVETDMAAMKEWQRRQNGTLQELHNDLRDSRQERFKQIEDLSAQIRALTMAALTLAIPVIAGLLYLVLNHALSH